MVATDRFRWLSNPARRLWYIARYLSELAQAPGVLIDYRRSFRDRPLIEIVDFVFSAYGGLFRPFQNRVEMERFLEKVRDLRPDRVIEIGTARGGTLFLLSCVAGPTATLVSIDLPAGPFGGGYPAWKGGLYRRMMGAGQSLRLLRGNSHSDTMLERAAAALGGEPVDLLFIDADHSYTGAKSDFLRYRGLVREGGLVVFHDIVESRFDKDVTVAPLWNELAARFEACEIVEAPDQGGFGIGVIIAPKHWDTADTP
jgi:predicted O-methyltransferase YrrM